MTVAAEQKQISPAPSRSPAHFGGADLLLWAVMLVGAILRIARWWHWRALWLDEIYLANSLHRSLGGLLFKPLQNWQAAPAGFLMMVGACAHIFGMSERSLRLTSLIFGLLSLPLMLGVSRRVLGKGGAIVAMTAFTFLGPLIYYSNELKPYSCDVAASLAVTLVALRWLENPMRRRAQVAAIVGSVAVFFSFPAVFVLAGAGLYMIVSRRKSADLRPAMVICTIWALAFILDYASFLRPFVHGEAHPHLVSYWVAQNAFMPPALVDGLRWTFSALSAVAASPGAMWLDFPDAALIGLIIGSAIAITRRGNLILLLAPLPLVLAASVLQKCPFGDRLAIFFVPQYLLLIGAAIQALWTNLPGKAAATAIAALIVLPSADRACGYLIHSPGREESLPIFQWVAQRYRAGDEVYLSRFGEMSFDYYEAQSNWPIDLRSAGVLHVQPGPIEPWQIVDDVRTMAGRRRVWVILIHDVGGDVDVHTLTLAAMNSIGHPVLQHSEPGAWTSLCDCGGKPQP
jgi:hypothetical protein